MLHLCSKTDPNRNTKKKFFFLFSHKKFYFGAPAIVRFCISKNTAVKVPNPFLWLPWNEPKSKVHPVFSQSRVFWFPNLTTSTVTTFMVFLASFSWHNRKTNYKSKWPFWGQPRAHQRSLYLIWRNYKKISNIIENLRSVYQTDTFITGHQRSFSMKKYQNSTIIKNIRLINNNDALAMRFINEIALRSFQVTRGHLARKRQKFEQDPKEMNSTSKWRTWWKKT